MAVFETVAIKNHLGERKVIRKDDFDPEKHEKFSEKSNQYGNYRIEEKGGGYKNVVHVKTGEVQNEKGLPEKKAIKLAKQLAGD